MLRAHQQPEKMVCAKLINNEWENLWCKIAKELRWIYKPSWIGKNAPITTAFSLMIMTSIKAPIVFSLGNAALFLKLSSFFVVQQLREAISSSGLLDAVADNHRYGKGLSIIAKLIPSAHHSPKPTLLNIPQQYHYHPGPVHPHNHKLSLHEPSFSSQSAEQGLHQRAPPRLEETINEGSPKQTEGTKRNRAVSVDMVRRGISLPGATTLGTVNAASVSTIGGQQSVFVPVPKKVPIMPEGQSEMFCLVCYLSILLIYLFTIIVAIITITFIAAAERKKGNTHHAYFMIPGENKTQLQGSSNFNPWSFLWPYFSQPQPIFLESVSRQSQN